MSREERRKVLGKVIEAATYTPIGMNFITRREGGQLA